MNKSKKLKLSGHKIEVKCVQACFARAIKTKDVFSTGLYEDKAMSFYKKKISFQISFCSSLAYILSTHVLCALTYKHPFFVYCHAHMRVSGLGEPGLTHRWIQYGAQTLKL